MAKTVILHIQGNELSLMFPIVEVEHMLQDGYVTKNETAKNINGDIWVVLSRGSLIRQYQGTANGNYIVFHDHGHLPCGEYDITAYFDYVYGHLKYPMRFKQKAVLSVVDTTEEGQKYQSPEYDVVATYPVINGRESAVVIGNGYVRLYAGRGLNADIGDNSINLRAGYGNSEVEIEDNEVKIKINNQ